ncbi:MAG TPA: DUF167 domain-containing protein [Methanomicrobiales archaeon]|jgi:uncharacterized protein (TIGR00251 family)|nr:DUF167 domain-containing protein [Methanomicrobiales archaeon]
MESFGDAVTGDGDGVILSLEVSPGSGEAEFLTGYDPWRKSIRCAVRSPPEKGRANREVIGSLAGALGVPANSVEILSGATRARKKVRVAGITRDVALQALGRFL